MSDFWQALEELLMYIIDTIIRVIGIAIIILIPSGAFAFQVTMFIKGGLMNEIIGAAVFIVGLSISIGIIRYICDNY